MGRQLKSSLILLTTAMIWGGGFIGQRIGMDSIGPFYFTALRSVVAFIAVSFVAYLGDRRIKKYIKEMTPEKIKGNKKEVFIGGICCGTVLFLASNLQQFGLVSVDAGKAGFITALYIVLVPVFGIFLKNRTTLFNWIGAIMGAVGLYFLCITGSFGISFGDTVIVIGAVFWAMHILVTDHFAPNVNVVKLSAIQFLVCAILSLITSVIMETVTWEQIEAAMPAIIYCGLFSSGLAFTLQAKGQKNANPTVASVILSTESLWALIFGFVFLNEVMTQREITGCIIMFAAVIISQIPERRRENAE